jgi:hypothetical protein
MRRVVFSLAIAGALVVQQAAAAELQCLPQAERSAFEVAALRSHLMVLATGCHEDDGYNAFVRKYQSDLMANERAVGEYFSRHYGKRGQSEHDRFTTDLANAESDVGMHLGSDFCPRNRALFPEVLSLRSPTELAAYAAGKDLIPPTIDPCAGAPAAKSGPAQKASAHGHAKKTSH